MGQGGTESGRRSAAANAAQAINGWRRPERLAAPGAGEVNLKLNEPLLIYSRYDLNRLLLERAGRAGAQIEKTRVLGIERQSAGWRLNKKSG